MKSRLQPARISCEPRTDVAFEPDAAGYWEHPDFRWALIPEETGMNQYFTDAGFELAIVERDLALDQIGEGCVGWSPEPLGNGWFLVLVVDTEDGPEAAFARRKSDVVIGQRSTFIK